MFVVVVFYIHFFWVNLEKLWGVFFKNIGSMLCAWILCAMKSTMNHTVWFLVLGIYVSFYFEFECLIRLSSVCFVAQYIFITWLVFPHVVIKTCLIKCQSLGMGIGSSLGIG